MRTSAGLFQHRAGRTGLTRAESVRQAQLDMIAGKAGAQFRRPAFRAPYALIGDAAK
jgi:CHAT domain-containing protein